MERVDKEQDGSGEGKTWSNSSETEVAGSNSADTEAEGPSARQKIAAHGDDDDLEEGEIRDEGGSAGEVRVMCSLYQKGACAKGHKCSFFHASFGEKGQYQMFDQPVKTNSVPPANFQPLRPPPRAEYFSAVPPSNPWNNSVRPVDRFGRDLRYRQRSERFHERDEFPHNGHEASQWHGPWSSRHPARFWSHERPRSSHRSRSHSSSRSESRSPSPRSCANSRSKARHAQRKGSSGSLSSRSNSPFKTRTPPRSRPYTKLRSKSSSESSDSDSSRSSPDFKSRSNHKPRSYNRSRSGSSSSKSSPNFKSSHRPVSYNKSRSGSSSSRLRSHSAKQSRSRSGSRSASGSESDSSTRSSTCAASEGTQLPLRTETADYNDQCERPLSPEVQGKKVQRQSSGYNRSEPKEDENGQKGTLSSERQPQSSGYLRREPLEDDNGQKGKIRFRMDQNNKAAMGKLQVPRLKRPAWEIAEESPPKKKCVSAAANACLSEPPAPEHQKRSSKPTLKKQDASALSATLPLCSTSSSSLSPDSGVSLSPSVNHCSRSSRAATAPQCVSVRRGSKRTNDRVRREEPRQPSAEGSCPSSSEQSQSGKSLKERMLEELQKVQLQIAKKKAYVNRSKKRDLN